MSMNNVVAPRHQIPFQGQKTAGEYKLLALLLQEQVPNFFVHFKVHLFLTNDAAVSILHLFNRDSPLHPLHEYLKIVVKIRSNFILAQPIKMDERALCLIV
jgi:hypothetical protein